MLFLTVEPNPRGESFRTMESLVLIIALMLGLLALFLLSGMWIGPAIAAVGIVIYILFIGGSLDIIGMVQFNVLNSFIWTAMPLFILMGHIVFRCGLGDKLYTGAVPLVGILPGGLLHTNILSCAIFAASSGSSLATAATMGPIAIPELKKRNYDKRMIFGSIAAGGTLGIMIPPSIPLIVYGAWVGESVGKLFIAGIIPGIMFAGLFMAYIALNAVLSPGKTPGRERINPKAMLFGLKGILPVGILIFFVLGTIYLGVATPTEAAALGTFGAIMIAAIYRRLHWTAFKESIVETVTVTGMMVLIVVGTQILSMTLADLRIPARIAEFVASAGIHRGLVFVSIVFMYLVLGCFMDALSMTLLTLPITYPLMMSLGFDSVWFGVIVTLMSEIALITPPVGMILFIIQGVSGENLSEVVYGTLPFILLLLVGAGLLYAFPGIAIWLPQQMFTAF